MDELEKSKKEYQKLVEQVSPKSHFARDCFRAFWVGGVICTIGQGILEILKSFGYSKDESAMLVSIILVFIGAFLTALDIYDSIGKYAGGGSIVPITGFANSIVSPAMEYKREGYIFGVGAKMFTIAGPVIVYGTISSIIVGVIYYFFK